MKEIEACEDCNHTALKYHGIYRHFILFPNGNEILSNSCNHPSCQCKRVKISVENPLIAREKIKAVKMLQEVMG